MTALSPVELTITIAAYREAENLTLMLPSIKAAAAALTPNFEILIADTEQPMDDTAAICAANGVRHVFRSGGNSYGDATRTLIAQARGTFTLNMDADGSHSPPCGPSAIPPTSSSAAVTLRAVTPKTRASSSGCPTSST